MKNASYFLIAGLLILVGAGLFIINGNGNNQQKNVGNQNIEIILFYGDGCPHCAKVDEFIKNNNIEEKILFAKKEVYNNTANANELSQKAEKCGMDTKSIGVPFLWDGEKCLVGDEDIIKFFEQKANESNG